MAPYNGEPSYLQQVALAIVPKVTGSLSILGSSYIIFDCARYLKRQGWSDRNTYRRLMIGLSSCDIVMSVGFFFSTWPMPRGTPYTFGARGTTKTCTAQGFFLQIGVAAVLYNASLSTYYLLRIRYGWTPSRIVKIEPWLHAIPLVYGLATMIAGLPLKLYNYGIWDCWVATYPLGCKESWRNGGQTTCIRGDNASLYQFVFDLIPKWMALFLVVVNMILTYRAVKCQEARIQRYSFERRVSFSRRLEQHSRGSSGQQSSQGSQSQQSSYSQRLAVQSYLYVGALFLTNIPLIVTRVTQFVAGVNYYAMFMTIAVLVPMQGFWNLIVYLRPRYLQRRQSGGSSTMTIKNLSQVVRDGDVLEEEEAAAGEQTNVETDGKQAARRKSVPIVRDGQVDESTKYLSYHTDAILVENAAHGDEETASAEEPMENLPERTYTGGNATNGDEESARTTEPAENLSDHTHTGENAANGGEETASVTEPTDNMPERTTGGL